MSVHIEAKQGEIAESILLPGDPLRAKYIAETFLEDVTCYNNVRGMLGFTELIKENVYLCKVQVWVFLLFLFM